MKYEFEGFRLDCAKRRLFARNGVAVELPSRAFDLLLYMVARPGDLLDKTALLKAIWPNTVVEEGNLSQCIFALRRALGEQHGEQRFIATVPGRGYQFVASVREIPATAEAAPPPADPERVLRGNREVPPSVRTRLVAGALLLASVALASWRFWPGPNTSAATTSHATADVPTIVVLPFVDLSPDHDMGYFADGLAEELMNSLGRSGRLHVIGQRSVFQLRSTRQDIRAIGVQLNAEYVLEGLIRPLGEGIRIDAQVVATRDGQHLWSKSYERRLEELQDIRLAISREVIATLLPGASASGTRTADSKHTSSPDAYNAYLRGIYLFRQGNDSQLAQSVEQFRRATQADPEYALAHAWLGRAHALVARRAQGDIAANRALADAALDRALKLDPRIADLWWVRMWPANLDSLSLSLRAATLERAISDDPGDAAPMLALGYTDILLGRREKALKMVGRAYRADPLWPNAIFANLSCIYNFGNDRARVERLLDELAAVSPTDPRPADFRAEMAFAEGRALDWDRFKARALEIAPRDQFLHGRLSLEYAHLGIRDAALHHARISGEVNPHNAAGAFNLAHLHLFSGDIDAARPIVKHAISRWPNDYLAQLAQAEMQYFSGDCGGAVRATEVARPAFQSPASSLDLMTDAWNLPILVWCLRQQGSIARARELAQAYEMQFAPPIVAGAYEGVGARVAAAAGNRVALLRHLENMARTHAMDLAFSRAEPMIQPFLEDLEVTRLLDRLDGYRADWRRIIPKSSTRVVVPMIPPPDSGS